MPYCVIRYNNMYYFDNFTKRLKLIDGFLFIMLDL